MALFFLFSLISLIHMHGAVVVPVCLRFQGMQMKQVDCKMSTKKTFKKTFRDIFGQQHTNEFKATKK